MGQKQKHEVGPKETNYPNYPEHRSMIRTIRVPNLRIVQNVAGIALTHLPIGTQKY